MRRVALGFMIGCCVGAILAMGLHTLFSAAPELAAGPLGRALAWVAHPGARAISAASGRPLSHELGIFATWLSLQLTTVLGGGLAGALVGLLARDGTSKAPQGREQG
jgi:hypothetical protein